MNWLEQFAILIVVTTIGTLALFLNFLKKKVVRLENKLHDETFQRLHREAKDALNNKSNSDLIDDANKRYGGGKDS